MGVFPGRALREERRGRLPHARGGVSRSFPFGTPPAGSSPRPWGCFYFSGPGMIPDWVFPTPVGVFLKPRGKVRLEDSLPHARGGVSPVFWIAAVALVSSPRPWGCFWDLGTAPSTLPVFPTPVGVFLAARPWPPDRASLPHARGGVSGGRADSSIFFQSSPRPWGCFCESCKRAREVLVFPTPVGVFPRRNSRRCADRSLPHARGGVSLYLLRRGRIIKSSPRPWGCFQARRRSAQ